MEKPRRRNHGSLVLLGTAFCCVVEGRMQLHQWLNMTVQEHEGILEGERRINRLSIASFPHDIPVPMRKI
jgi:hypothetical protein